MSVTDEIKERLDIVEVISAYVPLKKAGRSYKGLCPFHSEKTPSFVVFPDSQSWHCFGACSTGGDIFTFIMKQENLDFGEALETLAARAGVELRIRSEQPSADEARQDRLRAMLAETAVYFNYLLNRSDEAAIARAHLERRGLLPATWEAWQLGYALDSWDALRDRLSGKGYTLAEIEEAGLIIAREDGTGHYDRFRGRLMIPIRDVQGRAIGFGARLLREHADRPQPKYINSPQTPLFDKGSVLFGLDMARKAIRDANLAVVVEGYMDVLMSHQVGVSNVVAGMGTALTEAQMRQLKRYSSNMTLALDPDAAGDHATLRGLETARQALERDWEPVIGPSGLVRQESRLKAQLRIAALPDHLDPDELARKAPDRWRQVIAEAVPIVDYYLDLVSREEDLTSARGKANAVERMAPLIGEMANPVERSHYLQRLARLIQTDERLVEDQVGRLARVAGRSERPRTTEGRVGSASSGRSDTAVEGRKLPANGRRSGPDGTSSGLEEHILGYLLTRPDLLARLDAEIIDLGSPPISPEDFTGTENRAIMAFLQDVLPSAADWSAEDLLARVPGPLQSHCSTVLAHAGRHPSLPDEKLSRDLGDSLLRLRDRNLRQQIGQLQYLIMESEQAGAREQLRHYLELQAAYTAQKRHIEKLLSGRTIAGTLAQPAPGHKVS